MSLEARVGVFVIVSLLVLGATVYSVRTTQDVRGQVVYTTYLRYAGGIATGTPVLFAGIRVGQVASVRPSAADPTRIEITFTVKAGTPVNEESIARVGSVTLMSSPTLFLTSGSNNARRLGPGESVRSQEAVGAERDCGAPCDAGRQRERRDDPAQTRSAGRHRRGPGGAREPP